MRGIALISNNCRKLTVLENNFDDFRKLKNGRGH
jgi:hypothetical protein